MGRTIDDGRQAFPGFLGDQYADPWVPGMTLRQWYAGQALAGILAMHSSPDVDQRQPYKRDALASEVFAIADAMLAYEREEK